MNNLKMTDMEEKELKAKDIPREYPLCFNSECADKDRCMHYQARLLMPKEKCYGPAVFPTAWEDGKCRCFREKRLVKKAWGFSRLYDNVPLEQLAEARRWVHTVFGGGQNDGQIMVDSKHFVGLPRVCFAVEFDKYREKARLLAYNGLVVIEVNGLKTYEDAVNIRNQAARMDETVMAFMTKTLFQ